MQKKKIILLIDDNDYDCDDDNNNDEKPKSFDKIDSFIHSFILFCLNIELGIISFFSLILIMFDQVLSSI